MKTQIGERVVGIISTLIDERNDKGFETYKETLDDAPFENYDWNMMVIEELLDGMQYMVKENERLREENNWLRKCNNGNIAEMGKLIDEINDLKKRPNGMINGRLV